VIFLASRMASMTSTASVASMTSTASFHQKTFLLKVKMYIFYGLLLFITWKRPLKVKILRKKII
jgi:hypothetical protein